MANRRPVLSITCVRRHLSCWPTQTSFLTWLQLSFACCLHHAVAGPLGSLLAIIRPDPFFPERLMSTPQRLIARGAQRLASLLAVSAAAWLGSLPLTMGYFHLISITALPANALAVPLSFAIMAVAMLSLGTGLFSAWVASIYNQTNWLLAKALLGIVHAFASLPGSFLYVRIPDHPPPLAEIVVFDFGAGGAAWISAQGVRLANRQRSLLTVTTRSCSRFSALGGCTHSMVFCSRMETQGTLAPPWSFWAPALPDTSWTPRLRIARQIEAACTQSSRASAFPSPLTAPETGSLWVRRHVCIFSIHRGIFRESRRRQGPRGPASNRFYENPLHVRRGPLHRRVVDEKCPS
jgi:hypothetical protein